MRNLFILFLIAFTTNVCAQTKDFCKRCGCDSLDKENRYGDELISAYNTKGIYLVDTICIEEPVIIEIPRGIIYVMPYSFYLNNKWTFSKSKIKKMFYENEEYMFIYDMEWFLYSLISHKMRNQLFFDDRPRDITNWKRLYQDKNGFIVDKMKQVPDYFLLFLIRGDIYNKVTYDMVWDSGLDEREDFKDPKAYYKMAVPVWRK